MIRRPPRSTLFPYTPSSDLSRHGKNRLWTDEKYWFKDPFVWNLFIERINLAYRNKLASDPKYHASFTSIVEFSRGGERGFEERSEEHTSELQSRLHLVCSLL